MLCRNPYMDSAGRAFPCGQCMPCRVSRRRVWTHRMMLEASLHSDNSFVTLTYSDDCIPFTAEREPLPTLKPVDTQLFLKRLRKSFSPERFRFYCVGEYGDQTERPHYHLALFGYPSCRFGRSTFSASRNSCCSSCDAILSAWGKGQIYCGDLTAESAQYIAGYVTKKMTSKDDFRLRGRCPEFGRMSLRPGIGAGFIDKMADDLVRYDLDKTQADVPSALRHGSRLMPLGRYLKRRLRKGVGRDEACPESVLQAIDEELRPLREAAYDPEVRVVRTKKFKEALIKAGDQKVRSMEVRQKLYRKDKKL